MSSENAARLARRDSKDFLWWKHGIVYQIYPRSFQDSNGDGVGDLGGIIDRLDYLEGLGIDAVWLSPFYRSPMADFGYDISDYRAIDPLFGDMPTFQHLLKELHARGIRLIVDYVPNHTSDQHPWFQESRASRGNARRDWYIWRDPAPDGGPPNNWRAEFGGSSWTWDEPTGQYYYHAFLASQPDLNWRNPEVVEAMLDVLRFWLDLGVDGFRVDAIHHLIERADLADNPVNPLWHEGMDPAAQLLRAHTVDQPEVHEAIAAMRRVADAYDGDRVLIGEAYLPLDRLMAYYGAAGDGFHLPFNFHLIRTPWTPTALASLIAAYEAGLPAHGWPNWVLGNHDRPRLASRLGMAQARVAAMLLLTLRGTPTLYQGDELGIADVPIPPDRVRDPWELNVPGLGLGRDPVRTPMLWSAAPNAGFSSGEPWLPLSENWRDIHAERQAAVPGSLLNLYRDLIALRRREPALWGGAYVPVASTDSLLIYERVAGDDRLLVILELSGRGGEANIPAGTVLLTTDGLASTPPVGGTVKIPPNHGLIVRLQR
ncbi:MULTISPECIES: alpha-amylase family glycosyl hydrolase [Rhodomicrobium]|uniref:alpha-amylase family glycosyl hydrolase n=1 Tax=Rhodomicrobium TaxID=1068 RepID=UPI000B4B52EE|nr:MULTISPECIES: alpha-amylase family glycosyl hydrolase [Rhodomicrobium]